MATNFKCPHCGKNFEISEALKHEIKLEAEMEIRKQVEKEVEEKQSLEVGDLRKQLEEKNEKVEELRENELKLREDKRKLEEREKEMGLEIQRKIDIERKRIEEATLRQAVEEHRLKDKEKDKLIDDLKNALEEAKNKAQLGSQQLQGEVLELDLEETLRRAFPHDEIEAVGKGVSGADVRQVVRSPKGFVCGTILWESKRTKAWTDSWLIKLKSDLRAEKANIPIIVSSALPKEAESGLGLKEGVWVCGYGQMLPMATILRKNLLDLGFQKAVSAHKGDKAENLYDYITSHEFKQQLESLVEVYKEMQDQILKERASFERVWRAREGQMQRLITASANIVGNVQGRVGSSALQIKGLELAELDSGK
ncbi:hypothetical protein A3A76_03530 [Candidatus Woesebacteria bacterium RIFCSPLOWO2_01_FULL_39_23]|uniref:DUF2130 domain-containing protein n=1 Tax=Candidatus Woesebacteria bacterium RIFCSPHIGHO2_01_FULL_40_22 TaxID=1802499 RepID=A0A1F7YJS9_9BACT|nr:MAG: hypothetical protein A2141_00495 [Candidatus Woesebacteria bacterium RBG_16_40_11]OGM27527.1 MAG: hypothetical protein A2628_01930 [Candidatus Woesebacteria bacterium RIFCSPHIGHO2_01_FULL_40_22]OGM36119.1 MAG: hypothetical protein A3E41_02170 [Candidatus Woesebacteria bacterium RIFCSPHIGHO2_12_FULL_38_9]OGM62701.1 MAG: hypothetical protein A3A76_03530 [Candidatus Woesebacteria bacterium RIFCSPLOWO2_01_FULL_39_23]